jgi:HTH-type transcriptional regulator/antitoxin HigA
MELIEQYPLRPIRSERALKLATGIANQLAVQTKLTQDEADYLDVLSDLIERYEDQFHTIQPAPARQVLSFLLDENGLSQAQLSRETGIAKSTISAVLKGKRTLAVSHIEALCDRFKLDPSVLLAVK